MKFIVKYFIIGLLLAFVCFPLCVFSQANNDNQKEIQSQWILDDISLTGSSDTISFNHEKEGIEIYSEIEFTQNYLSFSNNEGLIQNRYSFLGDHLIYLSFIKTSFYAEWTIVKDKLYMEWGQDIEDPSKGNDTVTILLTYKRKID